MATELGRSEPRPAQWGEADVWVPNGWKDLAKRGGEEREESLGLATGHIAGKAGCAGAPHEPPTESSRIIPDPQPNGPSSPYLLENGPNPRSPSGTGPIFICPLLSLPYTGGGRQAPKITFLSPVT